MARVLLVGSGPLPGPGVRTLGFPQLRLAAFLHALQAAGHEVRAACLSASAPPASAPRTFSGICGLGVEAAGWLEGLAALSVGAEVIVSAGPYLPGRAACLVAGDRPVWVDLPGDPFAELQAVARAEGAILPPERLAAAQAAAMLVLGRADRLSVISERQRLACLGQLGVLGRLLPDDAGAEGPVSVVPVAGGLPMARGLPRRRPPGSPMAVALCGGFNTWLDDQALAAALEEALSRSPALSVVVTGGEIEGHYAAGYERFVRWQRQSRHRTRVTLRGWVAQEALQPALSEAHVGLYLDRPGCEALLGSRTRLHLFTWLGLEVVATPSCELAAQMAAQDLLLPVPVGDPAAVAEALSRLAAEGSDGRRAASAAAWLARHADPARCLAPLLDWVAAPRRCAPAPDGAAVSALVEENERLAEALRRIHQGPTWRALSRLHRLSRRLLPRTAPGAPSGPAPPGR